MQPQDTRNVSELIEVVARGSRPKYVFFWGHKPPREGAVDQSCLRQWYAAPFTHDGLRFPTAEHFMMHAKALLFSDAEAAAAVLKAAIPGAAKAIGRSVRGFRQDVWQERRFAIVMEAARLGDSTCWGLR